MKKVLAILVIAFFLGGITAPVFASSNSALISTSIVDKDPKKAKKAEKKSAKATSEKKSSDCTTEAKKDCGSTCGGSSK